MASQARSVGRQPYEGGSLTAAIGAMRHKVRLLEPTRSKDGGGFATDEYEEADRCFAEAEIESGLEPLQQGGVRGERVARFRIRYRTDILATWRVEWRGQTYELVEPPLNLDGRRRFLWLRGRQVEGN